MPSGRDTAGSAKRDASTKNSSPEFTLVIADTVLDGTVFLETKPGCISVTADNFSQSLPKRAAPTYDVQRNFSTSGPCAGNPPDWISGFSTIVYFSGWLKSGTSGGPPFNGFGTTTPVVITVVSVWFP